MLKTYNSVLDQESKNHPGQAEPDLVRKLSLFSTTNIVIANMIGAGIFTTSGLLIKEIGHPILLMVLWVAGGLIALCGALCYGVLASAMPRAGGEYVFLSRLFHPIFGFLSGWVSFLVGFSAPIAASAIGVSEYLARSFPQIVDTGHSSLSEWMVKKSIAIAIVITFTLLHSLGIELSAKVQNGLTILKVGIILSLLILGFTLGSGDFGRFSSGKTFEFDFAGWKTICLSLMWIMFAYSGWNAAAYIGSEVKNPQRNLPLSLILGTGLVTLLYLALNALFIFSIPLQEMSGVISVGGLAAGKLFGLVAEKVVSLIIAFALFSSLSAFIILGPRVYYAMARDGYFLRWAAEVHPRFLVPVKSIFIQGLVGIIFILSGTFDQILTYMGFALGIFPLLAVGGVFKLYHQPQLKIHLRRIGFPVIPLCYMIAGLMILILGFMQRPVPSSIAILTVIAGIPVYLILARKRGRSQVKLNYN